MNCKQCKNQFSNTQGHFPRVLVSCGHTICETCIQANLHLNQICCKECNRISFGSTYEHYPINANLLSIFNSQSMCKTHNQKLEAYCEKDEQLLCLSCVIGGGHKSHKITSISQKVQKDRNILQQSAKQILNSKYQIEESLKSISDFQDKIQQDYKDILLQVGLFFNNLKESIKDIEGMYLNRIKEEYESGKEKLQRSKFDIEEKHNFMEELLRIKGQLSAMPDLNYLHEDNKRIFIVENCKHKKPKIENPKLIFNKVSAYTQTLANIQDLLSYEKKIQNQMTPTLKNKKKSQKQPTVLEVNLHEQYSKHYKNFQGIKAINMNKNKMHTKNNSLTLRTPRQSEKINSKKQAILQSGCQDQANFPEFNESLQTSMIQSFMQSSMQNSFSIKGSQSQFTICSFNQKLYHIGSYNDSSIQVSKLQQNSAASTLNSLIGRSKFQCVNLTTYSPQKLLIFGGKSNSDEKLNTFLEYDVLSDKINQCNFSLSQPKSGFGSIVKEGKIYVVGGSNNKKSLKTFQEYRLVGSGLAERQMTPMNFSRDQLGVTLGYDGNIYACGGINESGVVLSSCERYNWKKSKWQNIPNMKTSRRCFSLVSLPHGILAIGGYNGKQYLNNVELFDLDKQKWIQMPHLLMARFAHTAVVTNDLQSVIVSGGFNKYPLKCVEIYDIMNNKWKKGQDMINERFLHCSMIINF